MAGIKLSTLFSSNDLGDVLTAAIASLPGGQAAIDAAFAASTAKNVFAVLDSTGTTIENLVLCDLPAHAAEQGWIAVTPSATCRIGSTTPDKGTTWVAPPLTAQETAAANATALATQIPAKLAQVSTDAATFAGFTTADLTTDAALAIHQRVLSGLVELVEGVGAIAVAAGVVPAPGV